MKKNWLLITPGDPDGIGPEITWKALKKLHRSFQTLICVGAREPFDRLKAPVFEINPHDDLRGLILPKRKKPFVPLISAPTQTPQPGIFLPGYQSGWSIQVATQKVLAQEASALVTGPISKERLQKGGFPYPGHTEFLAQLCQKPTVTMMLANQDLRVSLVTIHTALADVSKKLTQKGIRETILQTAEGLQSLWKIKRPRIAVAALNPHAGESGLFGREEIDVISPEINQLKALYSQQFELTGPIPADTLFAKHLLYKPKERWDAVVCMYHDQGLIPVKLLDFHNTVNITLGLPIIRTSVDHGVGFDIAGKGIANPDSLISAIHLASQFSKKTRTERKKGQKKQRKG